MERLRERKERHRQRGRIYRVSFGIAGALLVLLGLMLSLPGVPGPGLVVAAVGLAMLALEFDRAERLLERLVAYIDRVSERAGGAGPVQKLLRAAVLALGAAVALGAVILWDIPFLPG